MNQVNSINVEKRLETLVNIFQDFSTGDISTDTLCERVSNTFAAAIQESRQDNMPVLVNVEFVENANKEVPFFFRLSPLPAECSYMTNELSLKVFSHARLEKAWQECSKWVIEIDSTTFDNTLSLNPYEITALCYNTVMHTLYSGEVMDRFYRIYKDVVSRFRFTDSRKFVYATNLFVIPLFISSTIKNWGGVIDNLGEAPAKEKIEHMSGFEKHLYEALLKIIKTYGNNSFLTSKNKDDIVETEMVWACAAIKDIVNRKHLMKAKYVSGAHMTNSKAKKEVYLYVANNIGLRKTSDEYIDYENITLESFTEVINEKGQTNPGYQLVIDNKVMAVQENAILNIEKNKDIALEAFFKKNKKKMIPDQYDIDEIIVEVDRITNHHDRLFVLDLIYKQYEKISALEEMMETDKKLKSRYEYQVIDMKKQLDDLRIKVLNKKNLDKEYKIFVKVPEGYEG